MGFGKSLAVTILAVGLVACAPKGEHPAVPETVTATATLDEYGMYRTPYSLARVAARVKENPQDFISWTLLGQLQLRFARETGNLDLYKTAEQSFRQSLTILSKNPGAATGLAASLAAQHRFKESLAVAIAAHREDPSQVGALGTIFDCYVELGDYASAKVTLTELKKLETATHKNPAILAREAQFAELTGNNHAAMKHIKVALQLAQEGGAPQEEVAWYQYRLGDLYVHNGQPKRGIPYFRKAIETMPTYYVALNSLAVVLQEQGQTAEAERLFLKAISLAPSPNEYFSLGALYHSTNRLKQAEQAYAEGVALATKPGLNAHIYKRALAEHYAEQGTNLDSALALIEADLAERQDVHGDATYAWVLYRIGRFAEAQAAIKRAQRIGIKEAQFFEHAKLIAAAVRKGGGRGV